MSENNTTVTSNNSYSQALFELASENYVLLEVEEQAIAILELLAIEDVTLTVQKEAESVDVEANISSEKFKQKHRPNMNFIEMGIEIGEILTFERDQIECSIYSPNRVKYLDDIYSLTGLTKKLLGEDGTRRRRRGTKWWFYKGKNLVDIYNETYSMD